MAEKSVPLLVTKLNVPPPRPALVARPRLLRQMDEALRAGQRLVLVSAPAGFGKTTLLSEWVHRHKEAAPVARVAWLSLDEGDNDPVRFWSYFAAALRTLLAGASPPEVATRTHSRLPGPAAVESLLTPLVNEIAATPGRLALILDDYHAIRVQAIHDELASLLEYLPPNMHLILAGRADPPLPLSRFRVRNQMTELREADLRFTAEEAAAFMRRVMGLDLSDEELAILERRTEGWIAGLQLAAIALRSPRPLQGSDDIAAFVRAFGGSHRLVLDYLAEEVLRQQPADIQDFVRQTSILDRLCASLCDAVTGREDSETVLAHLERANLFLIPMDGRREWFRYHHLFAEFLQQRLHQTQAGLVPGLHRRASEWHQRQGVEASAIDHALSASDMERAADLIEAAAEATMMRSEVTTYLNWVEALPEETIRSRPILCLYHGWALLLSGQPLEMVQARLRDADRDAERPSIKAAVLRAFIAAFQGQSPRALELSQQAMAQLPQDDLFLRSVVAWNLGMSHIWRGDFLAGDQALEQAASMGQEAGNVMIAVAAMCHLAELRMFQGHLHAAKSLYEEALSLAADTQGQRLPIAGMALIGLGELSRERDELETATRYLEEGIELARQWGQIGALDGYIALARTRQALGDTDGVARQIQKAIDLAAMFDTTELDDRFVAAHQARLRIIQALQDPSPASQVAADTGFPEGGSARGERGTTTGWGEDDFTFQYVREIEGFSLARLLTGQGKPSEALAILEQLRPGIQEKERRASLIEIRMLEALALQARGESARAIATLESALRMAEPEGYVRLFVDEGEPMARLLRQAAAQGIAPEYVGRLLAAFRPIEAEGAREAIPPTQPTPLTELLVERELQVLRLIAAGLTNREIGEELFIATSTVKWHVNNLYGKLDVHNRTQAVARARELKLI